MYRPSLLLLVALLACACSGPPGQRVTAAEYAEIERRQAAAAAADASKVDRGSLDERTALDDRAAKLVRERAEADFEEAELESRRERMLIAHTGDSSDEALALQQAAERVITARAVQLFFTAVEQSLLTAEDALGTRRAEDSLLETREELAQLELMYGPDPTEATAEIVVARTRRRVVNAEERLRLSGLRSRRLTEVELPKRLHELILELQSAEARVGAATRALALGKMDREAELREQQHDGFLLQLRIDDIARRELRLEEDVRSWERDASSSPGRGS
jgi:hypothetical protein